VVKLVLTKEERSLVHWLELEVHTVLLVGHSIIGRGRQDLMKKLPGQLQRRFLGWCKALTILKILC
jgi:hypothetical protein